MRAAIRSQEDPASGLFAAFASGRRRVAADGRTRSRSPRPCRRGGGRTQVAYGAEFSGTTGWLAREPGKSPVTPAYPQLTAPMAAAALGDRLRLCAPPYAHADSQCSVSGLNLMKHQVAGDSRRPPVRSVSSGRAARARRRADHFNRWQLHDARQGRPLWRPCCDGRLVLAVRQTAQLDLGHTAYIVEMADDTLLPSTGLNELQNDRSPGSGRGTEGHGQLCRLRPNETVLRHRARTRHQLDVAAGVGEICPLDLDL